VLLIHILTGSDKTKFNYESIDIQEYNLFEGYFLLVNKLQKKIQFISNSPRVIANDIIKLTSLFEMLVFNQNQEVRARLSKLLVNLCLYFKTYVEDTCSDYWILFIDLSIFYFNKSIESKNTNGISGMILLMNSILKEIESGGKVFQSVDITNPNNGDEYIFNNSKTKEKKSIKIGYGELIIKVREKVSYLFEIPIFLVC